MNGKEEPLRYAVCYYIDGGRLVQKTLRAVWDNVDDAVADQLKLCGGSHIPDVNGCVRGVNGVVSWLIPIRLNEVLNWTLAVSGPNH